MKPACGFRNVKAGSKHSIYLCHVRQKAKPKHAATPKHVKRSHGGGWPWTSPRLHQQATWLLRAGGLSGLPVDACQSCYEWSPLAVCNDSTSAVKQMLPCSITDNIWRRWLLVCGARSCRALGLRMPCVVIQPSGLGWGSFVDSEAPQMSQTFRAHKSNTSYPTVWWGFLVLDLKDLWIIVLLKPAVCVHWVLHWPALFSCPGVMLCHVTKKYSVCFRHLLPSFFNCEASNFLIKYQVLLNTVTIASDKNVANHLYCSSNHLHECEKQIFKIEVLTPIYCCNLK